MGGNVLLSLLHGSKGLKTYGFTVADPGSEKGGFQLKTTPTFALTLCEDTGVLTHITHGINSSRGGDGEIHTELERQLLLKQWRIQRGFHDFH